VSQYELPPPATPDGSPHPARFTSDEIRRILQPYRTATTPAELLERKRLREAINHERAREDAAKQTEAQATRPTPPVDNGHRLLTIRRTFEEELRISINEFRGHRFVSFRLWTCNRFGDWYPDRERGVTIRARDLQAAIAALVEAARILEE